MEMHVALVSSYTPEQCGIAAYTCDLAASLVATDSSLTIDVIAEHGARLRTDPRVAVLRS